MSDITTENVKKAFAKHQKLSWPDFTIKNIFLNITNGTERAHQLGDIIRGLENNRIIKEVDGELPPAWEYIPSFDEIKGFDYHILLMVRKRQGRFTIGNIRSEIMRSGITNSKVIELLSKTGAITIENERDVIITEAALEYIKNTDSKELELIHESVFDEYDFALLEFLYNRNDIVYISDFPEILKTQAPQTGNWQGDGKLHQSLFKLSGYVTNYNNVHFIINDTGKAYFKKLMKDRNTTTQTTSHLNYVDNSTNFHGDGNINGINNSGEIKGAEIKKNEEDKEGKKISKRSLLWTIIGVVLATAFSIIALYKS